MDKYWDIIAGSFSGYWHYLIDEVTNPSWHNYFYLLIAASALVWLLEIVVPWRQDQPIIRKDFWLDGFYMFFNFFLFSLIGYNAISNVAVQAFNDVLGLVGLENIVMFEVQTWPFWMQFLLMFVLADFIQWNVHRLLHRVPWMWEFHKVHHSVKEMGFAAHLRFHWMETVIYKSLQYIPLAMIGFGIQEFFLIHALAVLIGHLNHANLPWGYGWFGYIFNNPKMHIWHHSKEMLESHPFGTNFGLSLSMWDYLFGTAYIPSSGRDIELGFEQDERFPKKFWSQITYPWSRPKRRS